MTRTFSLKTEDITRRWYILDASEVPLGRLSTVAARLLIGKDKPKFTPHIDAGDYVVVINSDQLVVTGNKREGKIYYRHSGYPGGLRKRSLGEVATTSSEEIIRHAVRGMLPDNKLHRPRLARLKIYHGSEHAHQAQNPEAIKLTNKDKK